jgi:hypothetical protein
LNHRRNFTPVPLAPIPLTRERHDNEVGISRASLSLKDVINLQDEASAKIGNVILNIWVVMIANLLKRNLPMSFPVVVSRGWPRRDGFSRI